MDLLRRDSWRRLVWCLCIGALVGGIGSVAGVHVVVSMLITIPLVVMFFVAVVE